jgi:pimeloyl-ACP methyl ester carboxylesterase
LKPDYGSEYSNEEPGAITARRDLCGGSGAIRSSYRDLCNTAKSGGHRGRFNWRFVVMTKKFKSNEGKQLLYESYDKLLESWNIDKEERDIETNYGKTHIILTGNIINPSLLLFHGTGDNSAMTWLLNIQELTKHFYVIAIDTFAGAGKTEPNERYFHKFDPALWIDEIMNVMNIKKTNVAGVSYGVNLSLTYAITNPDKVNKIICMAGYIPLKRMKIHLLKSLMVFFPEILIPTEKNVIKLLHKLCGPNMAIENKELMKHWFYILKYGKPVKQKIVKYSDKVIPIIRDKALFLIGEFDKLTYYPPVIQMLEKNNLKYKIIKNAGHCINQEQPEIINEEIIRFFLD